MQKAAASPLHDRVERSGDVGTDPRHRRANLHPSRASPSQAKLFFCKMSGRARMIWKEGTRRGRAGLAAEPRCKFFIRCRRRWLAGQRVMLPKLKRRVRVGRGRSVSVYGCFRRVQAPTVFKRRLSPQSVRQPESCNSAFFYCETKPYFRVKKQRSRVSRVR